MQDRLPNGPRGRLWQSLRFVTDPYHYAQANVARYGRRFTVPLYTGPVVVTGELEDVKAVFAAPLGQFDVWSKPQLIPVFGEGSIFVVNGEEHRRHRRAVTPPLQRPGRVEALIRARVDALQSGQVLDVEAWMMEATLAVMMDVLFGQGGVGEGDAALGERVARYGKEAGELKVLLPLVVPWLRRSGYWPWARFVGRRQELWARLGQRVDAVNAAGQADACALGRMQEQLSRAEVLDDLVTLLLAGHETTSHATVWAVYSVLRHPEVLRRLEEELEEAGPDADLEAIEALSWLDAVCEETLRVHPVAVQITRMLAQPMELGGCPLDAGVTLALSARLLHGREDVYEAPAEFRPERHLGRRYAPWESISFGGGRTRCPGALLARREMKLVLYHLFGRYRLRLLRDRPVKVVIRGMVMVPSEPVRVVLTRR